MIQLQLKFVMQCVFIYLLSIYRHNYSTTSR